MKLPHESVTLMNVYYLESSFITYPYIRGANGFGVYFLSTIFIPPSILKIYNMHLSNISPGL